MRGGRLVRAAAVAALAVTVVIAAAAPVRASRPQVGIGVYGVYGIPIIQEDVGSGPLYGAKLHSRLFGPLGGEVFYTSFIEGDVTFPAGAAEQTRKGGTQTVLGVNATLGGSGSSGVAPYLTGGLGSYSLTKDFRDDLTRLGVNGGFGLEFRSNAGIAVDLSGRAHVVLLAGGGTRKFGAIQAGINYYFLR